MSRDSKRARAYLEGEGVRLLVRGTETAPGGDRRHLQR